MKKTLETWQGNNEYAEVQEDCSIIKVPRIEKGSWWVILRLDWIGVSQRLNDNDS